MLKFQCVIVVLALYLKGSLSKLSVCGHAPLNSRIVDKDNAPEGAWPWQVSLQSPGENGEHFCGGSLISKNWVLTSAQCFSRRGNGAVAVYLGKHTFNGSNPNQIIKRAKKVILHPDYNSTTKNNDIALVNLNTPVPFSDYIRPVCLAGQDSIIRDKTIGWITGWENTNPSVTLPGALKESMVPVANPFICNYLLNPTSFTENMFCAGYVHGSQYTCQGDVGGPMVVKLGAVWIQAGITSFVKGCAKQSSPVVFTVVSHYQTWISSVINNNPPEFVRYSQS